MQEFLSSPLPMLVALVAIFYFLVFRPQQQHAKRLRQAIEALRRGDTVVTSAGILGKVAKMPQKEEAEITVEIADGVEVQMVKSAITEVRPKAAPANDAK